MSSFLKLHHSWPLLQGRRAQCCLCARNGGRPNCDGHKCRSGRQQPAHSELPHNACGWNIEKVGLSWG